MGDRYGATALWFRGRRKVNGDWRRGIKKARFVESDINLCPKEWTTTIFYLSTAKIEKSLGNYQGFLGK